MKAKNKMKKYSFIVSLALALSLALSPVSAFAEELDTPVHEDPIDEIQESSGWVNGHFIKDDGGKRAEFDVRVYCEYHWTEGISGWIDVAAYTITNVKVNGGTGYISYDGEPYYCSHGTWGEALKVVNFSRPGYSTVTVAIAVFCDTYGDLSINAYIP